MKMKAKFLFVAGLAIGSLLVACAADDDDDSPSKGGVYYDTNTGTYERYDDSKGGAERVHGTGRR